MINKKIVFQRFFNVYVYVMVVVLDKKKNLVTLKKETIDTNIAKLRSISIRL